MVNSCFCVSLAKNRIEQIYNPIMTYKQTAWIKNSREATGQDQLGLRFFSETIYQELLPNITNVTSRGRYFSFYPWLIWSVEKRTSFLKGLTLQKIVRRADCLLTLIGLYHNHQSENSIQNLHDGLIGAKRLGSVLAEMLENGKTVEISKYATVEESPDRYFKNKFGGLGQYYFGPLRDAGILAYNQNNEINYTEDRGLLIAEAFDKSVNGDDFFEVLQNDQVSEDDLLLLLDFCPCRLSQNEIEQSTLIDFFFSRIEIFQHPSWKMRRNTLHLVLDFIEKSQNLGLKMTIDSPGVHQFLSATYTDSFNENILWNDDILETAEAKSLWRQYYAGEMISYFAQALFWAGLIKLLDEKRIVMGSKDYSYWFSETFGSCIPQLAEKKFSEIVEEISINLPELAEQENSGHEIYLTRQLEKIVRDKSATDRQEKTVEFAIHLLLALATRFKIDNLDFPVTFTNQQINEYPINLANFIKYSENDWQNLTVQQLLGWIAAKWGIETHLMIALRKLQQESLDTFKVFPSEEGLQVKEFIGDKSIEEILLPGFTSPRLRTTLQILWDLGLIMPENESFTLTNIGINLLEEIRNV